MMRTILCVAVMVTAVVESAACTKPSEQNKPPERQMAVQALSSTIDADTSSGDTHEQKSFIVPKPTGFVNDFAHVLPDSSVRRMLGVIQQVRAKTKGEIVVITVPSLQGRSASEASLTIARAWRVGYAGAADDPRTNTGVVILLAPNEREVWIQLGTGANAFISNARATQICDEVMRPYFKVKAYGAGLAAGVDAIATDFAKRFK